MSTKPTDILNAVRELAQTDAQRLSELALFCDGQAKLCFSDSAKSEWYSRARYIRSLADRLSRLCAETESQREGREDVKRLEAVIERDRRLFAECVERMRRELRAHWWMVDSRGSYEWDDKKYQDEFGAALLNISREVDIVAARAADLSDSPRTEADLRAAHPQRERQQGQWKPTEAQLSALFALMMCSDPWPVTGNAGLGTMHAFCDELAAKLGFDDWVEAYHALPSPETRT